MTLSREGRTGGGIPHLFNPSSCNKHTLSLVHACHTLLVWFKQIFSLKTTIFRTLIANLREHVRLIKLRVKNSVTSGIETFRDTSTIAAISKCSFDTQKAARATSVHGALRAIFRTSKDIINYILIDKQMNAISKFKRYFHIKNTEGWVNKYFHDMIHT